MTLPDQGTLRRDEELRPNKKAERPADARLGTVDVLRGLAALAVAWFHFTVANQGFLDPGWLKSTGEYGWLGVEVFFVISGFIIPFALARAGYRTTHYGRFLLKRVVRLDPPYVVALAITVGLGVLLSSLPGYRGQGFSVSAPQVLLHLGYLNVFFGYDWLNPVFWTLAIEVQYYVLIGLIFSLLVSPLPLVRRAVSLALLSLAFALPAPHFVFSWLPLFLCGVAMFQFRVGVSDWREMLAWLALAGAVTWGTKGPPAAITGVTAALLIGFVPFKAGGVLGFLGNVSYSLYLLHVPVGGRVVTFSQRFDLNPPEKILVLAAAIGSSLLAAWALWMLVERPAQRWSSALRYVRLVDPDHEAATGRSA